ncbi:MAG: hypothetical protein CL745_06235 [Chloroflexi bacterium]|nr:hypothetical protein [Chloroflexota bacterium]|tara:strand:+ start:1602 stop:2309 length:708 start_codon:yes stop_codon:yes gene_type:complete
MKKIQSIIFLFMLLFISTSSLEAQAWKKNLKKLGDAVGASEESNPNAMTSEVVVLMTKEAFKDLATAQALIAKAEGNNELASQLENVSKDIMKSDLKGLKKQTGLVLQTAKDQQQLFTQKKTMSDEAKKYYQQALVPYMSGAYRTIALKQPIEQFAAQAKAEIAAVQSEPWRIMKVKKQVETGLFLVKNVPSLVITLLKSTGDVMTYSKENGLDTKKASKIKLEDFQQNEEDFEG